MPAKPTSPQSVEKTAAAKAQQEAQPPVITMPTDDQPAAAPVIEAAPSSEPIVNPDSQTVVVPALDSDQTDPEADQTTTDTADLEDDSSDDKKSSGRKWILLITILVLILVAAAGAAIYFYTQFNTPTQIISPQPDNQVPTATPTPDSIEALEQIQSSDELDAIEQDIDNTDLNSLDEELNAIDSELNSAL